MAEIGLGFYAGIPGWAVQYANAPWHVISDPPEQNPLPGKNIIGRAPSPAGDQWEWDCVLRGQRGAEDYANYCKRFWLKARYPAAWLGPNEPLSDTRNQAIWLSDFYTRLAPLAAQCGVALAGGAFSRGRPSEEPAVLEAYAPMAQVCKYVTTHEYGLTDLREARDYSWHAFRTPRLIEALARKGVRRPFIVTELGLDNGLGWTAYPNLSAKGYAEQLRWWALESRRYPDIVGAVIFHVSSYSYPTFACGEEMCREIAAINTHIRSLPPVTPEPYEPKPMTFIRPQPQLRPPVDAPVTQEFGCDKRWGTSPVDYSWITTTMPNGKHLVMPGHNGRDYGAVLGAPVMAAHAGRCWCYVDDTGYGNTVEIWCPDIKAGAWYKTIYAHLSEFCVKDGQLIEPGMVIGRVGHTGNSTGDHLHFGIKFLSGADNPGYRGWCDPRAFLWS